jgi:hypothetical protein
LGSVVPGLMNSYLLVPFHPFALADCARFVAQT